MVYICVLNYNNAEDTIKCLESLLKLNYSRYKIILIDNASTDNSKNILVQYVMDKKKIIFLSLDENKGYAAGNNAGLKKSLSYSDMDYCWVLNNDTTVEPDALFWLIDHMKNNPDVGLCGSKLLYSWDKSCIQGYGGLYRPWMALTKSVLDEKDIPNIDYVIGASVFISREFLNKIGLMCEDYFLYFEELDWAERARGKFKLSCEPRSIVYHKEGAVVGANSKHPENKSELADYYSMRNRLLFTRKFYPRYIPTVYLSSLGMIWNRFRRHQYKRMWMFVKLLFGIRDKRFECS